MDRTTELIRTYRKQIAERTAGTILWPLTAGISLAITAGILLHSPIAAVILLITTGMAVTGLLLYILAHIILQILSPVYYGTIANTMDDGLYKEKDRYFCIKDSKDNGPAYKYIDIKTHMKLNGSFAKKDRLPYSKIFKTYRINFLGS